MIGTRSSSRSLKFSYERNLDQQNPGLDLPPVRPEIVSALPRLRKFQIQAVKVLVHPFGVGSNYHGKAMLGSFVCCALTFLLL